jgi:hypothetical protein
MLSQDERWRNKQYYNKRQRNIILLFHFSPFEIQPATPTDSQHVFRIHLFSIPNFNYFKFLCIFCFLSES